ncbi:transposase [Cereibacter sphaeroides]|uniref:transposase n=1 Tax=Cereibacter sphaeroides TaxID=1063 RepID=UPI00308074EF
MHQLRQPLEGLLRLLRGGGQTRFDLHDVTNPHRRVLQHELATLLAFRRYFASKSDCSACPLRDKCCPGQPARTIARHIHEAARDIARRLAGTGEYAEASRRRKMVEMLFAHLKRILRLDRLRLRGPNGARDEFHLAATAQNLRKMAKLIPMPPVTA